MADPGTVGTNAWQWLAALITAGGGLAGLYGLVIAHVRRVAKLEALLPTVVERVTDLEDVKEGNLKRIEAAELTMVEHRTRIGMAERLAEKASAHAVSVEVCNERHRSPSPAPKGGPK